MTEQVLRNWHDKIPEFSRFRDIAMRFENHKRILSADTENWVEKNVFRKTCVDPPWIKTFSVLYK